MHSRIQYATALALVFAPFLQGPPASGQTTGPAAPADLAKLVPADAIFYVERAGHEAVRTAFKASNLGKMAGDEGILRFVHGSRVRIGRMIVRGLFDLEDPEEITRYQQVLHGMLKPFWHKPAAMFVAAPEKMPEPMSLGFLCMPGQFTKECTESLEILMAAGVPPPGEPGKRQAFTYTSGPLAWRGVARGGRLWSLPADPKEQIEALKGKSLFMVCQAGPAVCIATGLSAADGIAKAMTDRKGLSDNEEYQLIMAKTALKDWAFKWYVDPAKQLAMFRVGIGGGDLPAPLNALGLEKIRSAGGTGGYADNVYTRKTYVHAPGAGLTSMFQKGGSYQKALAMFPSGATFCLAGQLDKEAVVKMVQQMAGPQGGQAQPAPTDTGDPTKQIALAAMEMLVASSDGRIGFIITDLQAFLGMMMARSGPPVAVVVGLSDRVQAARAIDTLAKAWGGEGEGPPGQGAIPRAIQYRKIPIRYVGGLTRIVILQDRAIVAFNDTVLQWAIDVALDSTGGLPPDSQAIGLAKLAGDGPVLFIMDLQALCRFAWPMLIQMSGPPGEMGDEEGYFPFVSMPATDKLAGMLGPEVAVFQPDDAGLLLSSRGKIPFATKFLFYPVLVMFMFGVF